MELWVLILAGIGLWFFLEGAIYAVAPDFMRSMADMIAKMPRNQIMIAGLVSAAAGAFLLMIALSSA